MCTATRAPSAGQIAWVPLGYPFSKVWIFGEKGAAFPWRIIDRGKGITLVNNIE
jgi:hypothetical protein